MIKTVNVFCRLLQPDGTPCENTRIEFRLPCREIDDGVMLPQLVVAMTNSDGEVTVPLWPNQNGLESSYYDVTMFPFSKIVHDQIVVPDNDCNLHDIMQRRPFPPVDAAQQAVIAAQAAAAEAKHWADEAANNGGSGGGTGATIEIGSVVAGDHMSVTNSGTNKNAIFDFVLQKGEDGQDGLNGTNGRDGTDGHNGADGKAATITIGSVTSGDNVSVTNSGTATDAKLDFVLKQGDKGADGANGHDGRDGTNGTDGRAATISIGTVSEGSVPNVTNSGTSIDATLNFTLVRGEKGEKGSSGADGIKGDNGVDGKSAYQVWLDSGNTGTTNDFLQSIKGAKGDTGAAGQAGAKGDKGDQGIQGIQGAKGDTGQTGATGAKGDDGKAATVKVGTVTASNTVTVTNVGTNTDATLNFTFPDATTLPIFGQGQSWQAVNIIQGTTYTNTTGKPIIVSLKGTSTLVNGIIILSVDNIQYASNTVPWINATAMVAGIIPSGSTYSYNQASINNITCRIYQ